MGNKNILVIETDPGAAFLLSTALKALPSCMPFICRSVSEAKAYLGRVGIFADATQYAVPDAVITELRQGTESVYELLGWMRESEALRKIRLYVLAGAISPSDRQTLKNMGIKRVIEKPGDPMEMKQVLSEIAEEVCGPQ